MPPGSELFDLSEEILDCVIAQFAAYGVDLPDRQYVTQGQVVDDCAQLVVSPQLGYPGLPGAGMADEPVRCWTTLSYDIAVRITRCIPGPSDRGEPPTVDVLMTSAEELLTDGWVLGRGLLLAIKDGCIGGCSNARIDSIAPFMDGGYGGWEATLQIELVRPEPVGS